MQKKIFIFGGRERGQRVLEICLSLNIIPVGICITAEDPHEKGANTDLFKFCASHKIPTFPEEDFKKESLINFIKKNEVDLGFIAQWRRIIPPDLLSIPAHGIYGIHQSLLPLYRGFAPLNWAIINGETKTGLTLLKMDKGIDSGDIIVQKELFIGPEDSIVDLDRRAQEIYKNLLESHLENMAKGSSTLQAQNHHSATYACRRSPEDGIINWHLSAQSIHNQARALRYPWPGAFGYIGDQKLELAATSVENQKDSYIGKIPGRVLSLCSNGDVLVLTGQGILRIKTIIHRNEEIPAAVLIKSTRTKLT